MKIPAIIIASLLILQTVQAQDNRAQYPPGLKNAYFGVSVGSINYNFTTEQLQPGYTVESIKVPHAAVRIVLYGAPITKWLSARITYMRPVKWVEYHKINGDRFTHTVWMNIAGLTLNAQVPFSRKFSVSGEAGFGLITRNGFEIDNAPVVTNASYGTGLLGMGLQYHASRKWDLQLSTAWSPANKKVKQPATFFLGAGFNYYLRELSIERVKRNSDKRYIFPRQFILGGFTTNAAGYEVNNFFAKGKIPVFWAGDAQVRRGISFYYQRNIFHARKVFAFDWAAGAGFWTSRIDKQSFFTLSLNPVFQFNFLRKKSIDFFFEYSVAGPTFISRTSIDSVQTGRHFTFHDFMGLGAYTGKSRQWYAGVRIAHYSNGNIFPQNDGVMIPLTFNLGYKLR
jgi:hypothetical protein